MNQQDRIRSEGVKDLFKFMKKHDLVPAVCRIQVIGDRQLAVCITICTEMDVFVNMLKKSTILMYFP